MVTKLQISRLFLFALFFSAAVITSAQTRQAALITQQIDNDRRVKLTGNTRPEVTTGTDLGLVDDATPLSGLQLVLHRSPEGEAAFTRYIAELHNPKSANFHKWLTNAQIGTMFGIAPVDLTRISDWLASRGFSVNSVSPDNTVIEFSGTAGMVRTEFHAPIHNLQAGGKRHFANFKDPELPEALMPVVKGIASLHNFMPHPLSVKHPQAAATGAGVAGTNFNYLSAADLATVYNFNPLFSAGITGKGQTIVLIENTDQYSAGDFLVFRKVFGLSRTYPFGTLTQTHPAGTNTCTAPGANGDDGEAAIDIEWASAAAPNAGIVNAACDDTEQFGGFLALANILQASNPPSVVSISYGEAEADLGSAENAYIYNLYASAAAEGISLFVSSGDEGAASADADLSNATHGIGVSGFTSTPFNVSVGGTDFGNIPLRSTGTYFSTTNLPNFRTALSYIPEIPWNDSCASALTASYVGLPTVGTTSFCNTLRYGNPNPFLSTAAGSGGPSGCAIGDATIGDEVGNVVSGNCQGYPKPAWQKLLGVPADGVRDVPDVSLMASNGFWVAYYAVCWSDPLNHDPGNTSTGETPCTGDPSTWAGFGGTSISSPIWAGIQALVNQSTGQSWGNPNTVLYSLANSEYGTTGNTACNSTLGRAIGTNCVFNDVTRGDIAVNCTGTYNCYRTTGTYGVLSTSNTALQPAYSTNVGWDFATGIGTANATNIVNAWQAYASAAATSAK